MDEYQHQLFFEANDLTDRDKKKVRRHFQKRRDSGGGDCGMIETTGGNIYKICFKEKEDQERVLQRKFHTITLPCGELRLTVSRTNSPQTFDQPSTSQSQTFTKETTKGLEKIFKLDIFLLYFLRDNPKAYKVLQKQLSSIGCAVQFDFDEEEAVVRGDIEKGPGGAFGAAEKWEIQVDRVFIGLTESYLCYHAVEPKKSKILMQDLSFVADDIKVYTENGYAVVVGESEAVNERIAILEKSLPAQKELAIVEKQFKLVGEEFRREMRACCPEVKILTGSGVIILEGPDKEVESGATKLDELIKRVKERKVKPCTALMNFITSSGADSKYQARFQQSLRNPVSLEVGLDLVLSSLSSDGLDEAEATLQRDLTVANVPLQGAAAVPPDLDRVKEILNEAKNQANSRELRVDVSFIPGPSGTTTTKVRLVGYSENVNTLKEVLHDYQMNQVVTQQTLNLTDPELLDCFDKIVDLIGLKKTKVTLKVSHFPHPCVLVSGPRCLVQETQQALISALACLVSDTLVLDGPGARQYFKEEGKVGKGLVESSCQVIIRDHSPDVQTKPRSISSPNVSSTSSPNVSSTRSHSISIPSTSSPNVSSTRSHSISIPSTSSPSTSTSIPSTSSHSISSPSGVTPQPTPRLRSKIVRSIAANKTSVEIKLGSLEDEQVNVLVVPMLSREITSTIIGKCLLKKAGNAIKSKFYSLAANCTIAPGDVLQVDAPPSLGCSKLFFIECSPWDGVRGQSAQALGNGLKKCLDLCVQQNLCSVAFPVIGPGIVLKYPLREAIQVLTENIRQFGLSASSGSLSTIHIVIKPDYPDSEECYHDVYKHLSQNMNQGGQAIFRSLTSELDDVTMTVGGGVKLQLVFGDITNETTDAVVNTTDFIHFDNRVCKDILNIAGPEVEAELRAAKESRDEIFISQSGLFPCEAIFHVCGKRDAVIIEELVRRIIDDCYLFGFKSVAIPAICAGAGKLDPAVVAGAILRGVKAATSSAPLYCLTLIRLVLIKINVFLAFKEEAMQMFSTAVNNRVPVLRLPHVLKQQQQPQQQQQQQQQQQLLQKLQQQLQLQLQLLQSPPPASTDLSILHTGSTSQSVFRFLGLCRKDVDDAKTKLTDLYQAQCSTQTFKNEELAGLTEDNMKDMRRLVEAEGLYVQKDQSGQGTLTVRGLKDGVNKMMQVINASVHGSLRREVRVREEEDLYGRVVWCILGYSWERLPKTANHKLENKDVAGGITDALNIKWSVDLQRMEAWRPSTGQKTMLKRLENLADFAIPLYWDNMAAGETQKAVALPPSSAEYRTMKEGFRRTVAKTVMKIERLQNVHLRRAYEARKKQISDKNQEQRGAGEKLLYHGTTHDNCDSIMKNGFNRRFSGQNATSYGHGTYFAVNAAYSSHPTYSKPAADGSQLMFVARVLTGIYTLGESDMRVPPPRSDQQPHERYDSVVDRMDNPKMYVVFHDNQAYPDYLITFK